MCTVGLLPQQHTLHRANSHRPTHTPPPPPDGGRKMASLAIPDELLVDILLRLPTPEDLIRASAACVSFRRLITDRSFLRRFRKIHPPPLLGFLDPVVRRFHPAVRPHPSAPAAGAVALAADFSFAFLPAPGPPFAFIPAPARDWTVREVRDGRVLLDKPRRHDSGDGLGPLFNEMVVCDPLHRQYLLLPPIPDDMAASVADQLLIYGQSFADTFLVPPGYDEEEAATATDETSFRVIWAVLLQAKQMAVVFSSRTGQWRALTRSESLPLPDFTWMVHFRSRHYAHGCFYWISELRAMMWPSRRQAKARFGCLCLRPTQLAVFLRFGETMVGVPPSGSGRWRMRQSRCLLGPCSRVQWGGTCSYIMSEARRSGEVVTRAASTHSSLRGCVVLLHCPNRLMHIATFHRRYYRHRQCQVPHPTLTSEERGELCGCLNHKKSTLEAWKGPSSQWLPKLQTPMTKQRRVVVGEEEALGLVQGLNLRRVQGRVA
ncbi:hypothetical protein ACQJBY_012726 [Aegilops geniculata]